MVVTDGLFGPGEPSALNLAGVLPWTYWRGLVVIAREEELPESRTPSGVLGWAAV